MVSHESRWKRRAITAGKHALSDEEVKKLLKTVDDMESYILLALAISTGMRREDIVGIETKDVQVDDDGTMVVSFWERKKDRSWRANVGGLIVQDVVRYMNGLPSGTRYLFPARQGDRRNRHMASKTAYNILQRYLDKAGISRRPFHALRATCVKTCARRGWPIQKVMELTGDRRETIESHYTTPTDAEMKEEVMEKPLL